MKVMGDSSNLLRLALLASQMLSLLELMEILPMGLITASILVLPAMEKLQTLHLITF
jgi:hypothetical protein